MALLRLTGSAWGWIYPEHRDIAVLAVQGPNAPAVLAGLFPQAAELGYMHVTEAQFGGEPLILSRSGYTGEVGFELFPPEEVVPTASLSTRRSPVTVVKEVVRSVLAAPVPHYYSMLEVARCYHEQGLPASIARFSVHPLFEDILSDQIPSERAHEIWTKSANPPFGQQYQRLVETVEKRLTALRTITKRIEGDLGNRLSQVAPKINIAPPPFQSRVLVKYIDRSTAIGAVLVTWVENDRPSSGRPPPASVTSFV